MPESFRDERPGSGYSVAMKILTFSFALIAALIATTATAGIRNGPYLQDVTTDSIVVVWETDGSSTGEVQYGTTVSMNDTAPSAITGTLHEVELSGLSPSTQYHYRVETSEGDSDDYTLLTAPLPNEPFELVFVGDTRTNTWDHEDVVAQLTTLVGYPDLLINTGDMVEDSDVISQWDDFFSIEHDLLARGTLLPVVGNHDDADSHWFFDYYFAPPPGGNDHYYSLDYGNLHLLVLDTQETFTPGSDQYVFIENDLGAAAANTSIEHIFVAGHWPAYSSGAHGLTDHDEWGQVRDYLQPLFETYGVDIYWCGHDHHYERAVVNNVTYIVTGGGGAPADLSDFLPEELLDLLDDWGLKLWDPDVLYGDLVQMIPGWQLLLPLFDIEFDGNDWKVEGKMVNHFVHVQITGGLFVAEAWDIDGSLIDTWTYGAMDPNSMDDDGDGLSENEGDCDDTNPDIGPDATEYCNGIDDNCDGVVDEGCADDDDDTVGDDDDSGVADDDDIDPSDDDTTDTPMSDDDDDQGGCECATAAGPSAGSFAVVLLALIAGIRRR